MTDFRHADELKARTKRFAIRIVKLFGTFPKTIEARVLGTQLLKSGTSLASNYRAVCRARSRAEFIAKLGTVVEESDETVFWLELLLDTDIGDRHQINELLAEARELLAIFSASRKTAKSKRI